MSCVLWLCLVNCFNPVLIHVLLGSIQPCPSPSSSKRLHGSGIVEVNPSMRKFKGLEHASCLGGVSLIPASDRSVRFAEKILQSKHSDIKVKSPEIYLNSLSTH